MKRINKFYFFLLIFLLVVFNTKVFSDSHNIGEILKLIQKDLKTLEKAVYSENIDLNDNQISSLNNIDQN